MGILPNHVPLIIIFWRLAKALSKLPGSVAIMTNMAIRAENINEAKAEEARLAEQLDDTEAAMPPSPIPLPNSK